MSDLNKNMKPSDNWLREKKDLKSKSRTEPFEITEEMLEELWGQPVDAILEAYKKAIEENKANAIIENNHSISFPIKRSLGMRILEDMVIRWTLFSLPAGQTDKVKKPPATFLLTIADLLPKKQRQILQQEVLLVRDEYNEALFEKKLLRAKIIVIAYYLGICYSSFRWIADKAKDVLRFIPKKD